MIYVAGEILIDQFISEKEEKKFPGGAPFNVASNINHFGGDVTFFGSVGKDENGSFLKKTAKDKKFKKLVLTTPKGRDTTIALVTLTNGERSFKFIRENGADYILSFGKFKKLGITKGDIVHLGSLMLSSTRGVSFINKAINYCKEVGALVSFDVNYRDDIFSSPRKAKLIYKKILKKADIVKISIDELDCLSSYKRLENQVKELTSNNQLVFISLGKKGSCFYSNNKFIYADSISVTPIDTTGAGDAFYSYVLYSLLKDMNALKNEDKTKRILFEANIVGALATQKMGAIDVVPTVNEILEYVK